MTAELRVVEGDGEPVDRLIGKTIDGRYEVEKILGEGGMGLVYKARHIVLNKPLAIKVLRPDVSRDEEIITRFRQEAQSASAIGNQHIIDISDFGELSDKSTYFIMEYLDGIDLTGAIEEAVGMAPVRVVHIAKQLCRALGAAHEVGIVHRDLKPDNIYLIRRGGDSNFVKVLDFGIAKVGGTSSKLTRAGQVFGTPHYMSPEQCAGSGVDHRTDVYALGIILYEMCTGETPFDADNLMGILTKHLYEEPIPPRQKVATVPEELELVILKAMSKQIDTRYQNMDELLADLERVEAGVGTMARESTRSIQLAAANATMDSAAPSGRSKALLLAAAVMLLVLGGIGYMVTRPEEVVAEVRTEPVPLPPEVNRDPIPEPPEVEDPPELGAPAPAVVMIGSDPRGAEVWREGEKVGETPWEVERPEDGEVSFELRAAGYEPRDVTISARTAPAVDFALVRARATSTSRMHHAAAMEDPPAVMETVMEAEVPAMTAVTMMSTRPHTEVLDPWANDG